MVSEPAATWESLFGSGHREAARTTLELRVVRKHEQPWLLLPRRRSWAARGMSLYPAQRPLPRMAKLALTTWLHLGLPWPVTPFGIPANSPFARFLCEVAAQETLPGFALLSGNPSAPGRRFVVMIFDLTGCPMAVVKAGVGLEATRYIRHETDVLSRIAPRLQGVPRLMRTLDAGPVQAFAIRYFDGDSPKSATPDELLKTLGGWVDISQVVRATDLPQWKRLRGTESVRSTCERLIPELEGRELHPVVAHGDFVPWNIKVEPNGRWTVLDWDRGEEFGVPAWDWFHFVIQTGILVERLSVEQLGERVTALLASESFKVYASKTGIEGIEEVLLHAYLLHVIAIFNPTDGPSPVRSLMERIFPDEKRRPNLAAS